MLSEKRFFVYLVASGVRGTLYIGVTSNLTKRIWEHQEPGRPGLPDKILREPPG